MTASLTGAFPAMTLMKAVPLFIGNNDVLNSFIKRCKESVRPGPRWFDGKGVGDIMPRFDPYKILRAQPKFRREDSMVNHGISHSPLFLPVAYSSSQVFRRRSDGFQVDVSSLLLCFDAVPLHSLVVKDVLEE